MSKAGCLYDNAQAKSFFKALKKGEAYLSHYQKFGEAQTNFGAFLDDVYNVKQFHSNPVYLPPTELEANSAK